MFYRHQAEITVMQFTGHSLPVHQSMSVPWELFSSSHFISQFPPTRFPLLTAIGMCHFLPVLHLEWHFGPGEKVKTQHYHMIDGFIFITTYLIFGFIFSFLQYLTWSLPQAFNRRRYCLYIFYIFIILLLLLGDVFLSH